MPAAECDGSWECAACTYQNPNPAFLACEICGTPRHQTESFPEVLESEDELRPAANPPSIAVAETPELEFDRHESAALRQARRSLAELKQSPGSSPSGSPFLLARPHKRKRPGAQLRSLSPGSLEPEPEPIAISSGEEDEPEPKTISRPKPDAGQPSESEEVGPSAEEQISEVLSKCAGLSALMRSELEQHGMSGQGAEQLANPIIRKEELEFLGGQLMRFQLVGLNWLMLLSRHRMNGVLADEMGLGKTVQIVALLSYLHATDHPGGQGPHLVIAPGSTLDQWVQCFSHWYPQMRVLKYHGSEADRAELRMLDEDQMPHVLVSTLTYWERDTAAQKMDRSFFRRFDWEYLIMDEAHALRNLNSARFKRLSTLRVARKVLLSGTPVQNSLNELLCLLNFLDPGTFDLDSQGLAELFDGVEPGEATKLVHRMIQPFILRRVKLQVMSELVPKQQILITVEPSDRQRALYKQVLQEYRTHGCQTAQGRQHIFTQLRKVANHPLLVRDRFSDKILQLCAPKIRASGRFGFECTEEMVLRELKGLSDFELSEICEDISSLRQYSVPETELLHSSKASRMLELLGQLKQDGRRPLIFSQWTSMLDLVEVLLNQGQYSWVRLDGSTPVKERQELIDRYTNDRSIFVFLLSTRAGGLGINLAEAADTVILHDVDFNPSTDRQAEDRVHRIGQTKTVQVYKLVTKGTVDQNIYEIAEKKRVLETQLLGDEKGDGGAKDEYSNTKLAPIIQQILGEVMQ